MVDGKIDIPVAKHWTEGTPTTVTRKLTEYEEKERKWDKRFLELAKHVSQWSKDPSTQVGAVVVRPDKTVASLGYNGFPRGVDDNKYRYEDRTTKLSLIVHGELNALITARECLAGYTLYTWPFQPCARCAGIVIQAGIKRIVAPKPTDEQIYRWGDSFAWAQLMYQEAGIKVEEMYENQE